MRKRIIAMLTIIGLLFGTDSRGIPAADVSAAAHGAGNSAERGTGGDGGGAGRR